MAEDLLSESAPPTYAELLAALEGVTAENVELAAKMIRLEAALRAKTAEIERVRVPKRAPRKLDPDASSPYDRPWNGR